MPIWLEVQRSKGVFFVTLYDSINDMKYSGMYVLHFIRATVIFVVDCCQFGPSWIFGLKMELMACAGLVGGTTDKSCYIFPDLIC